jgi:hypothetical protein
MHRRDRRGEVERGLEDDSAGLAGIVGNPVAAGFRVRDAGVQQREDQVVQDGFGGEEVRCLVSYFGRVLGEDDAHEGTIDERGGK